MALVGKGGGRQLELRSCTATVQRVIQMLQNDIPEDLPVHDLEHAVENLANDDISLHNVDHVELDKLGTSLWNHILKKNDVLLPHKKVACLVRTLASLLIEAAQRNTSNYRANDIRVLKCVTRASRFACDKGELALAEITAEKAAIYNDRVEKKHDDNDALVAELRSGYLLLRIVIAWRQGRLDIAKLMHTKLKATTVAIGPRQSEQLSDLLYEIGKDQLRLAHIEDAIYWLDVAHDAISAYDIDQMSCDARDLKATILHSTARALLRDHNEDNLAKIDDIVKNLEMEGDRKIPLLLLKLEVLVHAKEPVPSPSEFCKLLRTLMQILHLTDANVKTLLYYIHILRGMEAALAHQSLLDLIHLRLIASRNESWMEKSVITLIWMATTSCEIEDAPGSIRSLFDELLSLGSYAPLEAGGAQTAHVLLWKVIESCQHAQNFDLAAAWCQVALHKGLAPDESSNRPKFERKLLQVRLSQGAPLRARESYNQMSISVQHEPLTQFLLFKIALSTADTKLAESALSSVCQAAPKDSNIIFACILEAQQAGSQEHSIIALLHLLRQHRYDVPGEIRGPALLRCTARMLFQQLDKDANQSQQIVDDLCELFEAAAAQARQSRRGNRESAFSVVELDWFSRNTYNLALKHLSHWPYSSTARVIDSCTTFIDQYPEDLEPSALEDLRLRRTFCHFVSGSLYTTLARSADAIETQLNRYLAVRKAVEAFRKLAPAQMEILSEAPRQDLRRKYASLIAYDYEAAARLKNWDAMEFIIGECREQSIIYIFPTLADITIVSEAPTSTTIKLLQLIINGSWNGQSNDLAKLARWMRCLLMLTLPQELKLAEKLLEQALVIVKSTKEKPKEEAYPSDELHWLAATAFNTAIEMHAGGETQMSRRWIEHALQLASLDPEGRHLYEQMQKNHQKLVWSGE